MSVKHVLAIVATVGIGSVAVAEHGAAGSDELQQVMQKGAREMQSMRPMGDVDHDFVMAMKKHHEDGIAMARVEAKYGKDEKAREFAQKVINDQTREVGELDKWMAQHKSEMKMGRR